MASFHQAGAVWELTLSNEEVGQVHDVASVSAMIGTVSGTPLGQAVAVGVTAVSEVIRAMNLIGGNNGVNVAGVVGTQMVTVTPRFVSPVGWLGSVQRGLQEATNLPDGLIGGGLAFGVTWLAAGPSVALLGGVAGFLGTIGHDGPNPGDVHADRRAIGPWERFTLVALNPDRVAMLSWRGYFCAERDGGHDVHANRPHILPWESHTLIRNGDGTVSFGHNGSYLVAEGGGGNGSVCNWNRNAIGPWEKFFMEFQPDGTFALKTTVHGTYVSVQ